MVHEPIDIKDPGDRNDPGAVDGPKQEGEVVVETKCEIAPEDLVYWAFQLASGMEYLANKKVFCRLLTSFEQLEV